MAVVAVDKIQPGAVLAAEVHDCNGRLLIPSGKELSERHLDALRMWGVTHCEIEGDGPEEDETAQLDPEVLAEAGEVVDALFLHNADRADHPFLVQLRDASLLRVARGLQPEASVDAGAEP